MIRWNSMVRIKESGQLGFICDFDSDVHGDPRDPSCVRVAALFGPGSKRAEWDRMGPRTFFRTIPATPPPRAPRGPAGSSSILAPS